MAPPSQTSCLGLHKKVRLEFPRRRKIETMLSLGTSTTLSQGNIHWSCKALKSSSLGCTTDERVTWIFYFSSLIFQLFIHPVIFHALWKKLQSIFHPLCKFPLNFLTSCIFSSIMQPSSLVCHLLCNLTKIFKHFT
jgi:hypothetical protein